MPHDHSHLVSNSYILACISHSCRKIFSLRSVGFTTIHAYDRTDMGFSLMTRAALPMQVKRYGKPSFIAEFGPSSQGPYLHALDPTGIQLHNGAWGSLVSTGAGAAMSWWWNEVEQLGLYRRLQGAASLAATLPLTSYHWSRASQAPPASKGPSKGRPLEHVKIQLMLGESLSLAPPPATADRPSRVTRAAATDVAAAEHGSHAASASSSGGVDRGVDRNGTSGLGATGGRHPSWTPYMFVLWVRHANYSWMQQGGCHNARTHSTWTCEADRVSPLSPLPPSVMSLRFPRLNKNAIARAQCRWRTSLHNTTTGKPTPSHALTPASDAGGDPTGDGQQSSKPHGDGRRPGTSSASSTSSSMNDAAELSLVLPSITRDVAVVGRLRCRVG